MPETPLPPPTTSRLPMPPRRRCTVVLVLITLVILVLDQASKAWALTSLVAGPRPSFLGGFITLHLVRNPGAAFSLATGTTWLFTLVALGVVVAIVRIARRLRSWAWTAALGLLLGGALGNLGDRLFREPGFARGHVLDFIDYQGWFIGNIADIGIVVGAALLVLLAASGIGVDGERTVAAEHETAEHETAGADG